MSSTVEGRKPSRRYALQRGLAPHVDEAWAESMLLELRLLGVDGTRIGEALSEVESHCAESGQSAQQAFGDPVEYARSLRLPEAERNSTLAVMGSVATIMVQIVGMLILNWSFDDWLRGPDLTLTVGQLVGASLALLGGAALVRFTEPVLRMVVRHAVPSVTLAYCVGIAALVIPVIFLDDVIWHGSARWGLAAGVAVLAGGVLWAIARRAGYVCEEDPITSPFDGTGDQRRARLLVTLTYTAMIPAGTVVLLAMAWSIHQIGQG